MPRSLILAAFAVLTLGVGAAQAALPPAEAKAAVKCQTAIAKAGAKLLGARLKLLDKCVTPLFKCLETGGVPGDCAAKAGAACRAAAVRPPNAAFGSALAKACGALSPAGLVSGSGLGFGSGACTQTDLVGLTQCLDARYVQAAERIFRIEQPRASDMVGVAGVDPATLPDLAVAGGCGSCAVAPPVETGKAVAGCAATVGKAARTFAAQAFGSVSACVAKLVACAATKPDDDGCAGKAGFGCSKAFAKLPKVRAKLDAAIDKKCGAIDYDTLRTAAAVNLDGIGDVCVATNASAPTSVGSYGQCVRRQHECEVGALLGASAPRTSSLLRGVKLPLDKVLCVPPCDLEAPPAATAGAGPRAAIDAGPRAAIDAGPRAAIDVAPRATIGLFRFVKSISRPGFFGTLGKRPATTPGAPNKVDKVKGPTTPRPGTSSRFGVLYKTRARTKSTGGRAGEPPSLIVTIGRPGGGVADDVFTIPLDAAEGEVQVDVDFADALPGCAFDISFATSVDGVVGDYTPIEQTPPPPVLASAVLPLTCSRALAAAGREVIASRLTTLATCGEDGLTCIQTKPGDAECFAKAHGSCAQAITDDFASSDDVLSTVLTACAATPLDDLFASDRFGFFSLNTLCLGFGVVPNDLGSIATCLIRQHQCRADESFGFVMPRIREIADLLQFTTGCLPPYTGGFFSGLADPTRGQALLDCSEQLVASGAQLIGARTKRLARCVDAVFVCDQESPGDADCLAGASATCDDQFAQMADDDVAFGADTTAACGSPSVSTADLLSAVGVDLAELAPDCAAVGVPSLASLPDYLQCVTRRQTCIAESAVQFEAPRISELLALVGRTAPSAFCP